MPVTLFNPQSHDNDGHGFNFAAGADAELHNPSASGNGGNGFNFEGESDLIKQSIDKLRQTITGSEFEKDQDNIYPVLDSLSQIVDKPTPDKSFLKNILISLRDFGAKASGTATGTAAIELFKLANEHWHLLQ